MMQFRISQRKGPAPVKVEIGWHPHTALDLGSGKVRCGADSEVSYATVVGGSFCDADAHRRLVALGVAHDLFSSHMHSVDRRCQAHHDTPSCWIHLTRL